MKTCMSYFSKLAIATLSISVADSASAQHGDVWLRLDAANDAIAVGVVDESGATFTPGVRVFESILTPDSLPFSPFHYSADDPGFLSAPGDLPPNQPVSLAIQSLQVWNGAGLEPASGVDFAFDLSTGLTAQADGSIHKHVLFGLMDLRLDPAPLPDGVYVASVRPGVPGAPNADLFYLVMLKDELIASESDAETLEGLLEDFDNGGPEPVFAGKNFAFYEEAVEFVASAVPEPSGIALVVWAALVFAMQRRT